MRKQIIYVLCQLMIMVSVGIGAEAEKLPPNEMRIKVKKLDGPQIIRGVEDIKFIDKNGMVIKKVFTGEKKTPKKFKDTVKNKEWNGFVRFQREVVISKNRQYALTSEYSQEILHNIYDAAENSEFAKVYGEGAYMSPKLQNGKLTLYKHDGSILWEKKFNDGVIAGYITILDDGKAAFIEEKEEGEIGNFSVYDKNGFMIVTFPGEEDKNIRPSQILKTSPSGRYLALRALTIYSSTPAVTVFFDLAKKTYWKAGKDYGAIDIDDNGIVDAVHEHKRITIDLKNFMGD